ncbi:MAG TPA: protein kinase [Bryobacteraceae bacterium]|nr:protein kinase [Bryobacteraceae bacterium]
MQSAEWEEIKRIFDAALKFSGAERAKFLEAACHQRPALLDTISELLRAHEEASEFLDDETNPLPQVFLPGQLVADRFRIVRLISRGGMGEVYETYDERLSVKLALKTLRPEYAADPEALERFRREIRVTRDFGHPNLCRVYELVEHHTSAGQLVPCLTMQLMSGETLQQYLRRRGPLPVNEAWRFVRQIASAIAALHENGIIHRDLKPSNIMITRGPDGEPRAIVMDFGLTKSFEASGDLFESRSDFAAGAPFYLAPELVRGEKPSIASDVYALGLIIDEMVTGGGAFTGDTVEAVLYQKLWNEPRDPAERKPGLPPNWCRVIRRALDPDPAKRFPSTQEIMDALDPEMVDSNTRPLPVLYRLQRSMNPRWVRSNWLRFAKSLRLHKVAAVLVAAAMVSGVAVAYIGTRPVKTSVLIYDFENLTGKPSNDYWSKGTTWEVERQLYDIPGISVSSYHEPRPHNASFHPRERFSIDGYVESDNDITRLAVKVTENATGHILWMNHYDTAASDSLKMQSEIASNAVAAMRDAVLMPKTEGWSLRPAAIALWLHKLPLVRSAEQGAPPTQSEEAMEAYTRGRALWEERSIASDREAVKQYEKALAADPNFALAEADLAGVYLSLLQFNASPRVPLLEKAKEHAERGVRIGPEYPQTYTSLAAVKQASWDWAGAEKDYLKAIAMNPRIARAHRWYGGFLLQFGRFEEGLKEARLAVDLDPYDVSAKFSLGQYLLYAGKPEEDVRVLEEGLKHKNVAWGHQNLAYAYAYMGAVASGTERRSLLERALREADAVHELEERQLSPNEVGAATPLYALIYGYLGEQRKAETYTRALRDAEKSGSLEPLDLAYAYVSLKQNGAAIETLKKAVDAKDAAILYMKVDPFFASLRRTPEFRAMLLQTGL